MLKTSISTNSSINVIKIVFDFDRVDDGGSRSGDFDVAFQVTCWRSRYYSSTKTVAFNYASKADHQYRYLLP